MYYHICYLRNLRCLLCRQLIFIYSKDVSVGLVLDRDTFEARLTRLILAVFVFALLLTPDIEQGFVSGDKHELL